MIYATGHESPAQRSATLWVWAPDAAAAKEAVRSAISAPGTVDEPEPLPYSMWVGFPEAEADAIDVTIAQLPMETRFVGGADTSGTVTKEPSDGFAELMIHVPAETEDGAARRGLETYRSLRTIAGLPRAEPSYFYIQPPWPGRQPYGRQYQPRTLLERAYDLIQRGDHDLGVVIAQTACEVLIAQVLNERLEARELGTLRVHITSTIPAYSLNDDRTRKLWDELTGDEINQVSAWRKYKAHIVRRNGIVHRGSVTDEDEAQESLQAVQAVIEHVEQVRSRPPLRPE
jgi:hypothetical protein